MHFALKSASSGVNTTDLDAPILDDPKPNTNRLQDKASKAEAKKDGHPNKTIFRKF